MNNTNQETQAVISATDEYNANQLARIKAAWDMLAQNQRTALGLVKALHGKVNPAAVCEFVKERSKKAKEEK